MHIPTMRERVYMKGQAEAFLVVWINSDKKVADLLRLSESVRPALIYSVPFIEIQPIAAGYSDAS